MHPHKILHPTDYSEASRPALLAATDLAREHGARLVLLHVVDTLGPEHRPYGEITSHAPPEKWRRPLWEELHRARPDDPHVVVDYVLSEEDVVSAILHTAAELGCDLIVMGSHGETGWRRWFHRSVAEEVVRRASCPVLVVKTPRHPEPHPASSRVTALHPGHLVEPGGAEGKV